jgi:hypothetical protein
MSPMDELEIIKDANKNVDRKSSKLRRFFSLFGQYLLYFVIIQVLWVQFSDYKDSLGERFSQLNDAIIEIASADSDYIRRCNLVNGRPFELSEVYSMESNIRLALKDYVKAFVRLNGIVSYSSYLELHEFTYCYTNGIINNLQDGCNLYSLEIRDIDNWKNKLLQVVDEERNKTLSFSGSLKNFFSRGSVKRYPIPDFSYGLCKVPASNTQTKPLEELQ